jgi:hypothetical protein
MTQDEYYDMRILLEKWVFHKEPLLPNPFDDVGIQVAERGGWYVYRKGDLIHVYDGAVQHCGMDRLFSCHVDCVNGIITALRMMQQKGGKK